MNDDRYTKLIIFIGCCFCFSIMVNGGFAMIIMHKLENMY